MIIKSFEIDKIKIDKNNLILLYGKNEGFKTEIINKLLENKVGIIKYEEKEILDNPENFIENVTSQSLFENEKVIIITPEIILKISEFCKRVCPKNDAEAPKIINTVENPKQNKTNGKKLICWDFKRSCKDWPEINETYPGIKGKTQGDKKLISPAPKAIKNSII